jgi:hypothetical protein
VAYKRAMGLVAVQDAVRRVYQEARSDQE